jgi:hypothetical protein
MTGGTYKWNHFLKEFNSKSGLLEVWHLSSVTDKSIFEKRPGAAFCLYCHYGPYTLVNCHPNDGDKWFRQISQIAPFLLNEIDGTLPSRFLRHAICFFNHLVMLFAVCLSFLIPLAHELLRLRDLRCGHLAS